MVGITGQIGRPVVKGVSLGGFSSQASQVIAAEGFCRLSPGYLCLYPKDSQGLYS